MNAAGVAVDVSSANPLPTSGGGGGGNPAGDGAVDTGTPTNVATSTSSATLLAANAARYGATIWNDAAAALLVVLNASAASATNATVSIPAGGYYEAPYGYTGEIRGVLVSGTGAARVTEFT